LTIQIPKRIAQMCSLLAKVKDDGSLKTILTIRRLLTDSLTLHQVYRKSLNQRHLSATESRSVMYSEFSNSIAHVIRLFLTTMIVPVGSGFAHDEVVHRQVGFEKPTEDGDPQTRIHWGTPVSGLVVGMRLPGGRERWSVDSRIECEMFLRNLRPQPVELVYGIPGLSEWNMNVEREDGKFVRLSWTGYSGYRRLVTRSVRLAPNEQIQATGIEAEVRIAGIPFLEIDPRSETRKIPGPTLLVIPKRTEFQRGDPRRLITAQGNYRWTAWISVWEKSRPDRMVIGSKPVRFAIGDHVQPDVRVADGTETVPEL
jgi:hypothetical protein